MGVVFPTKIRRICAPGDDLSARVIVVGLDSAGKTTLVQRFKNLVELQLNSGAAFLDKIITQPTCVFEVQTVAPRLAPLPLTLWDLGGQEKTRSLWRFYLTDVQGRRNANERVLRHSSQWGKRCRVMTLPEHACRVAPEIERRVQTY